MPPTIIWEPWTHEILTKLQDPLLSSAYKATIILDDATFLDSVRPRYMPTKDELTALILFTECRRQRLILEEMDFDDLIEQIDDLRIDEKLDEEDIVLGINEFVHGYFRDCFNSTEIGVWLKVQDYLIHADDYFKEIGDSFALEPTVGSNNLVPEIIATTSLVLPSEWLENRNAPSLCFEAEKVENRKRYSVTVTIELSEPREPALVDLTNQDSFTELEQVAIDISLVSPHENFENTVALTNFIADKNEFLGLHEKGPELVSNLIDILDEFRDYENYLSLQNAKDFENRDFDDRTVQNSSNSLYSSNMLVRLGKDSLTDLAVRAYTTRSSKFVKFFFKGDFERVPSFNSLSSRYYFKSRKEARSCLPHCSCALPILASSSDFWRERKGRLFPFDPGIVSFQAFSVSPRSLLLAMDLGPYVSI